MVELQNWLLLLAYKGNAYQGWQIQNHAKTIEGTLEKCLRQITGEATKVFGAGRTDAHVHALNQTANFHSSRDYTLWQWQRSLNGLLPSDIVVKSILPMPHEFHARHDAIGKRYRYLIYNKPFPSPFAHDFSWWIPRHLDISAMQQALPHFIGHQDFNAFRSTHCSAPSSFKDLRALTLRVIDTPYANLCVEVYANSFLQHMVRIIVGTLVNVAQGKIKAEDIPQILKSKDRRLAGQTSPPQGLYVLEVEYPQGTVNWPKNAIDP